MGRTGTGERDGMRKLCLYRTMHMTADDTYYLRMSRNHSTQLVGVAQVKTVHMFQTGSERRMMHKN